MNVRLRLGITAALMTATLRSAGWAAETATYTYDALGRLVKVEHVQGPNDGTIQTTAYDAAGNRSNYTVTGAHPRVIVLPLNGFTIIPLF